MDSPPPQRRALRVLMTPEMVRRQQLLQQAHRRSVPTVRVSAEDAYATGRRRLNRK
jgi:hypothetical protein